MTNLNNILQPPQFLPNHLDRTNTGWENSTVSDLSAQQVLSNSVFPSTHYILICNQNQEIHGLVVSGKIKGSSYEW